MLAFVDHPAAIIEIPGDREWRQRRRVEAEGRVLFVLEVKGCARHSPIIHGAANIADGGIPVAILIWQTVDIYPFEENARFRHVYLRQSHSPIIRRGGKWVNTICDLGLWSFGLAMYQECIITGGREWASTTNWQMR